MSLSSHVPMMQQRNIPIPLFLFQSWHTEELIDGFLGVIGLHLLRIVVLVFNVDIPVLLLILVFILEIITVAPSISCVCVKCLQLVHSLLLLGVLHEIIIIRHGGVEVCSARSLVRLCSIWR